MTREAFVSELDRQVKLVRTEYGFNQEVMARVLGISKKTLVEIEKGRSSLGWTGAVALCAIFAESQVLSGLLGGEAGELVRALAFQNLRPAYPRTPPWRRSKRPWKRGKSPQSPGKRCGWAPISGAS